MNTPRMSGAAMCVAVSAFAATAFAWPFPTPREQASRDSWARMWADAHNQHREFILVFNRHIAEARDRFWATYPDKPGWDEASAKFADLLYQKDIYMMSVAVGGIFANLGGVGVEMDGGIRRTARPEWDDLVAAAHERGGIFRGAGNMMDVYRNMVNPINLQGTLYNKYVWERDWWEYDSVKRIPARFEKPETYGIYLYYRFGNIPEQRAAAIYNKMVEMFGQQLVQDAAKKVMDAPKGDNGQLVVTVKDPIKVGPSGVIREEVPRWEQVLTALTNPHAFRTHRTSTVVTDYTVPLPDAVIGVFSNPLTALQLLVTRDDDRRYLLLYLKGRDRKSTGLSDLRTITDWEYAEILYRRLVLAFGEKDVLETARAVRTATKRLADIGVMNSKAIGARRGSPFNAFEDILARKNIRGYLRSALISAEKLDSPAAVDAAYKKLLSQANESDLLETVRKRADGQSRFGPNLVLGGELAAIIDELKNPPVPDVLTGPLVDYPEYLAWTGFSPDAKVSYATRNWQVQRDRLGRERLGPGPVVGNRAYQFQWMNEEQVLLWLTVTNYGKRDEKLVPQDSEVGYPAKVAYRLGQTPATTTAETALTPTSNFRYGAEPDSKPIESGEDVVEISGRRIATRWQSKSYRYKPAPPPYEFEKDCTLVVKVWTSDAVPTGLVRRTEDKTWPPGPPSSVRPYGNRLIVETYLESFEGTRDGVVAPDPSRPVAPAYAPPPGPPPAALTPAEAFNQRYGAVTNRVSQAKSRLFIWEGQQGPRGSKLPTEVRDARNRLDTQRGAAFAAMNKSDNDKAQQILTSVENDLAVIEKFLTNMQPPSVAVSGTKPANPPTVSRPTPTAPQQPGIPPELAVRMELSRRFNTLFNRASTAKNQLLLRERAPAGKAVPVPADVRTMRGTMDAQFKTALDAMNKSDVVNATQSLNAAEESLAAIETFLKQ